MNISSLPPKGMHDLLSDYLEKRDFVLQKCIKSTELFGYSQIETPIIERRTLFERTLGDSTDIVLKEMYSLVDGRDKLVLRPENTASVCRAYINKGLHNNSSPIRLMYYGPMFRHENPQSGRYRQFYQFGIEAIGDDSPEIDAEVIELAWIVVQSLGIDNLQFRINSIGDKMDRQAYSMAICDHIKNSDIDLSKIDLKRLEREPMRILDSREPSLQNLIKTAPKSTDFLSDEAKKHWETLLKMINKLSEIYPTLYFDLDPHLVRGLDYYNRTVFELGVKGNNKLGTIIGGGRYDNLITMLHGIDTPAVGFAIGIERLMKLYDEVGSDEFIPNRAKVIVLGYTDEKLLITAQNYAATLRKNGIKTILAPSRSLKGQLRFANSVRSKFVIVIGDEEVNSGVIGIKNLENSQITKLDMYDFVKMLQLLS